MARNLDTFPVFKSRAGRKPVYDWDSWLNGKIWVITRGEDFTSNLDSMKNTIWMKAKMRGLEIRINVLDEKTIVFQTSEES